MSALPSTVGATLDEEKTLAKTTEANDKPVNRIAASRRPVLPLIFEVDINIR